RPAGRGAPRARRGRVARAGDGPPARRRAPPARCRAARARSDRGRHRGVDRRPAGARRSGAPPPGRPRRGGARGAAHAAQFHPIAGRAARLDERAARGGGRSRRARRRRHGIRGPGRLSYAGGARARRSDDRARPGARRVGRATGCGPAVPLRGAAVRPPCRGRRAHRHGTRRRRRGARHPRGRGRRDRAGPRVGGDRGGYAACGSGPHRRARGAWGGGGSAAGGAGGRRCRRRGAGSGATGAARRVAAVGRGRRTPQRDARADPRSGRAGRPYHMSADDDVQLVTFKVAGQDFAFNIFQVERILRYEAPAPLPKAPDFLEGVLRYQGGAVPLVDLRKRLGAPAPHREETRTVILEWEGGKLGVVVDAVTEVLQVAASEVTAPPNIVKGLAAEYITGIVVKDGRTVIALN